MKRTEVDDYSPPWERAVPDGLYKDLSSRAYHDGPAISKSGLDLIHRSPAHFKLGVDERREQWTNREFVQPPAAYRLGSLAHTAILEPDKLNDEYRIIPSDINKRTKAGKAEFAEWMAENSEFTHVTQEEIATTAAMKEAVLGSKDAQILLGNPKAPSDLYGGDSVLTESSVYWHEGGVQCRCRPDVWHVDEGILVDFKTTVDASPKAFAKSVLRYRYHVQAGFYLLGTGPGSVVGGDIPDARAFYIVAVEKTPPFGVAVYHMSQEYIDIGRREALNDLAQYESCVTDNYWPSYNHQICTLTPPAWMAQQEDSND